jgi:predicted phage baseplate assembly protein
MHHFVAEVESDGQTCLRFGDDVHGRRPDAGTRFTAVRYRTGSGRAGNIGGGALFHVVTSVPEVTGVRNPLPASGGWEPEAMDEVRQRAPYAFRSQERAVTEADYATMAQLKPRVQRAAATFRWTGSWHTVFVTLDPRGGVIADAEDRARFARQSRLGLERYRMAGHDLDVDQPRYVSLEIEMHVCVKPDYFRGQVKAALLEVFSNRLLADGRRGVFHPDHFTFGQSVQLSPLYAAAQKVAGVESVHITTFQRQGVPSAAALHAGRLALDRLEIARCDNDPNFPEHGVFRLDLGGGK